MEEPTKPREPYVEFMEIETKRPYSEIEKFFNANPDILEALEMPYILESLERLPSLPAELNRTIIEYIIAAKKKHEVLLGKELGKILEESINTGLKEKKDKIWELLNEPYINVNVQGEDADGDTPLIIAIDGAIYQSTKDQRALYLEIIKALLQKGANPDIQNKIGETPLIDAVRKNDPEIVQLLLDNGANPNRQDLARWTALHWAVYTDNPKIVQILLDNGANLNMEDNGRETALILAVRNNNIEIVEILLNHGADEDTALNLARYFDNQELIYLIRERK